jgi:excisionase family DNA binding protein
MAETAIKINTSGDIENPGIRNRDLACPVLSVPEAAKFLRVSESIIRRLIREHRIPYFQIEGRYLLYRPALEKWIEGNIVCADGTPAKQIADEFAKDIWKRTKGN